MKRMIKRRNVAIVLAFISSLCINAQILEVYEEAKEGVEAGIIAGINATEKEMAIEKQKNNAKELAKLETLKEYAKKQLDLTEKIYKHYQDVIEVVETVSTSISTYKRVEQFLSNIAHITKLYSEYGVSLSFYSVYDLDKYINPDQHVSYINTLTEIYTEAEKLSNRMKKIVYRDRAGGVSATDFERYQSIKEINQQSRVLLNKMQTLINKMIYLVPVKTATNKSNIELKKSFYSYETYSQ